MPWDTEDWSMALAAEGATEMSMYELNALAPEAVREEKKRLLQARRARLRDAVDGRSAQSTQDIKEKNRQALEELRKNRAKRLPEGWKQVESRSRPGEFVYENVYTEERQAWFPTEPAVKVDAKVYDSEPAPATKPGLSEEAKERNRRALAARKAKLDGNLPEGWKRVPSRSRPGEFVYENVHTEERIAWFPVEAAHKEAMPEQSIQAEPTAERAKALYPYTAADNEEVDLEAGDILVVEYKADNGWWIGVNCRTGAMGMFPGGFVELVKS